MPNFHFERETRTPQSEVYVIEADGEEIARLDLHFSGSTCYATLCVPSDFDDDDIEALIGEIDERIVMSWDPLRDDFIVTVWSGREIGVFSESGDDEDEDNDEATNGRR
jgi:hypothetical protein